MSHRPSVAASPKGSAPAIPPRPSVMIGSSPPSDTPPSPPPLSSNPKQQELISLQEAFTDEGSPLFKAKLQQTEDVCNLACPFSQFFF